MSFISVFFLAVALSMDAFAVSITSGAIYRKMHIRHAFRIALFFGGFQALMPVIGWLAGNSFNEYIQTWDHWAAFGLLAAIGIKMVYESFKLDDEDDEGKNDPTNLLILLILSVATSIDALAVGLSLSMIGCAIGTAAAEIGIITFLFSYAGVYIGKKFGHFFENKIELIGGLILIGIGLKILLSHLLAG